MEGVEKIAAVLILALFLHPAARRDWLDIAIVSGYLKLRRTTVQTDLVSTISM